MRISDWSSDVCSSDLIPMIQSHAKIVALMALAGGLSMVNAHAGTFPAFGFAPPKSEYSGPAFQLSQSYPTTAPGATSLPAFFKLQIGRASCRQSMCKYMYISVVAG